MTKVSVELSVDGILWINKSGRLVYANQATCQLLGYTESELLELNIFDIDPSVCRESWSQQNQGNLGPYTFESLYLSKIRKFIPVQVTSDQVSFNNESYFCKIFRDAGKLSDKNLTLLNFGINCIYEAAYLVNEHSKFLYVNDQACQAHGYTKDDLLSKGIEDIDPTFQEQFWVSHWQQIKKNGVDTIETWHKRRNGSIYPVEIIANYFEYAGASYYFALARNITERKKTENDLKLTQFVVDHSSIEVYRIDSEGHILYSNQKACQEMGYSEVEMLTLSIADIDPIIRDEIWTTHWQDLLKQKSIFFETTHRRKDNSMRSVEVSANYINYEDKEYNFAFVRDITERKQAEAKLAASESRLRTIISTEPECVKLLAADGSLLEINAAGLKMIQADTLQQVENQCIYPLVVEQHRQKFIDLNKRVFAGETGTLEFQVVGLKGRRLWLETHANPLRDTSGQITASLGITRDITERKLSEARVLRLTNLYKALSEVNQAIVRMEKQDELFPLVCRCAVDFGGMSMAWVGQLDNVNGLVFPIAQYGNNLAYLDGIIVSTNAAIPEGRGPIGIAMRENRPVVVNDYCSSPMTLPWQARYINNGWKSGAAFPISRAGQPFAVLSVYDVQLNAFDDEAIALLKEMTTDIAFALDNFDREMLRKTYEESLQLAASIYETSSEAMIVVDAENLVIAVNPAFTVITGYPPEEIVGKNPSILKSGKHDEVFYQVMWQEIITTGKWQGEILDQRKNGEIYTKWLIINTIFADDGSVMRRIAMFNDITNKKASDELIWQHANLDALTGLTNRRMFQDRLEQEIKKANRTELPLTLLFLDLDYFKEVNDTLGHAKGDLLLKEAAQRLTNCVRESDTVARFGGDEFTILLSDLHDTESIDRVIQNILQVLSEPFELCNEVAYVSASIGVTCFPNDGADTDTLLKNADQAMYAAKAAGRNRYSYFTSAMQVTAQIRMKLANDLRGALHDNQLWVAYQPIVDLKSGKVIKAEALIRWQHPKHGLVSPAEFIPIAEHTGIISEIGEFVFYQAALQVKRLQESYIEDFQISVNVSPVQFSDKSGKYKPWSHQLKNLGLRGESIVVEITEGLLLEANYLINDKLLEFRDAGIQVALDDFGTGYSSLSYLKKFDIDYIKIDQSFVRNLLPNSGDMALCEAMVVMAHKLGLKVIAEGLETAEQRELLIEMGCDYAQGYLISQPIPANEFEKLLLNK
ncbi:MAG: PAS domain S-box protein [Methylotenera sp.]|uniref:PAS domain S-box protein n=1 Tax=Methylotenera sp. TaxID=2051956 RepID=UPI00248791A3|nr:PAS domain S-box protein [Methylotenera sp.]MDI1310121.1 PAS domain S-box protein [Methylotenera sp.]